MRTIAVINQKGGCGKTTVSINLASALAELGQKTLLVDMDPQSHCAVGLAVPEDQIDQSIYDVMISKSRNEKTELSEILWQITDNLELAPSSIDLSAFEQQMSGVVGREYTLKEELEKVRDKYDYVVIDCPPAVSLLTFNALKASSEVIVPVETGYFALHGLSKQLETLNIITERSNQDVNVQVLASMYDVRTKMAREILAELRNHFTDKMFTTVINFNTKIKEASSFGQPICEYDPGSRGRMDFNSLAEELLNSQVIDSRDEKVNQMDDRLTKISMTADEIISKVQPENKTKQQTATATKQQEKTEQKSSLDEKLSDYYGVTCMKDAVAFVSLYPRAEKVQIAGDFNGWQPEKTPMKKVGESGIWQAKVKIPKGKHRYRIVVDGKWQQDPYNETKEVNPFGEYNSVVEVK